MATSDPKADLHRYLQSARDALVWKLEGLSEYDVRRPLTPTGTNLLGLVKHVASVELGYFGGYSCSEIAAELAIPIGTVKSRMSRAIAHLRERLQPQAGGRS